MIDGIKQNQAYLFKPLLRRPRVFCLYETPCLSTFGSGEMFYLIFFHANVATRHNISIEFFLANVSENVATSRPSPRPTGDPIGDFHWRTLATSDLGIWRTGLHVTPYLACTVDSVFLDSLQQTESWCNIVNYPRMKKKAA